MFYYWISHNRIRKLSQAMSSSCHYQTNGQVEAYITLIMKSFECNVDTYLPLLHIRSTQFGPGLPSPATLLFNCTFRGMMPIIKRAPINANSHGDHYESLVERQERADKNYDTLEGSHIILFQYSLM